VLAIAPKASRRRSLQPHLHLALQVTVKPAASGCPSEPRLCRSDVSTGRRKQPAVGRARLLRCLHKLVLTRFHIERARCRSLWARPTCAKCVGIVTSTLVSSSLLTPFGLPTPATKCAHRLRKDMHWNAHSFQTLARPLVAKPKELCETGCGLNRAL
jgi:hypothetical protein